MASWPVRQGRRPAGPASRRRATAPPPRSGRRPASAAGATGQATASSAAGDRTPRVGGQVGHRRGFRAVRSSSSSSLWRCERTGGEPSSAVWAAGSMYPVRTGHGCPAGDPGRRDVLDAGRLGGVPAATMATCRTSRSRARSRDRVVGATVLPADARLGGRRRDAGHHRGRRDPLDPHRIAADRRSRLARGALRLPSARLRGRLLAQQPARSSTSTTTTSSSSCTSRCSRRRPAGS